MSKLIDKLNKGLRENYTNLGWTGSFYEFLQMVEKDPYSHTRTAFQYLNDTIHHFGSYQIENCGDQLTRYEIFDDPFDQGEHAVYGLDRTLMNLVANLRTISEGGGKERIIVLHGPVATAKTSIIRLLINGLKEYSKTKEGGIYTFNWVFSDQSKSNNVGFQLPHKKEKENKSLANLSEKDLVGNIPCQLNDNPLLLLPKKERRELLEEVVKKSERRFLIPKKILEGEPCFNCQTIYNKLLKKYDGDINKVFRHIQIERVIISEINKIGAATVQPIQNTEGHAPVVFWENSKYSEVMSLLKGLKIHQFEGKWADSNRGLIHLTDMFNKNTAYLQHLLSAVEEHLVDFNGIQGFIDSVIIGTTNQETYEMFKRDPISPGLKSRIRTVDIGYVVKPKQEAKIYKKEFEEAGYKRIKEQESDGHMFPHVLDLLALWSVMSRLKKPIQSNFQNQGLNISKQDIVELIDPLIKARIYDGELHDSLELEEKKMLGDKSLQKILRNEHSDEGMQGISPRTMQNLITDIISRKELEEAKRGTGKHCLSIFRIFDSIEHLIKNEPEIERFHHPEADNDAYHNLEYHLELIKEEYQFLVTNEIKKSIIGFNDERLKKLMKDYLKNIKAYVGNELIFNPHTNKDEPANEKKMRIMEKRMRINTEKRDEHRRKILEEIGSSAINNEGCQELDFKTLYKDLFKRLEEGIFEEKKETLKMTNEQLEGAINKFGTKNFENYEPIQQKIITTTLGNMITHYNYCNACAKDVLKIALQEQWIKF